MRSLTTPAPIPAQRAEQAGTDRRWFGTGHSADPDARSAGVQATATALAGRRASLLIVFCPVAVDLEAMLAGVRAEAGDVPLIGCSGNALFSGEGSPETAVLVSALGGDGFQVHTAIARNISAGQRAAGIQVAETVEALTSEHRVLVMLCDGLTSDQHEVVRGAYSVVGAAVPLVGGCAADDLSMVKTFQFYADSAGVHVASDAVVAAAIGSDAPIGVGMAHGWRRVGEPMVVTDSRGGRVKTLDDEPALDVFLARTGAPRSIVDDASTFQGFSVSHPLGMSRRSGEDLRCIFAGDVADGSITCLVDVPQGALLWTMESDPKSLVGCVEDACDDALTPLAGASPLGFLAFNCIARHAVLGPDGVAAERDRLVSRVAGTPLAGVVTYGEVARIHGSRGMHQLTMVVVAFA